jgi:hypothetical protein
MLPKIAYSFRMTNCQSAEYSRYCDNILRKGLITCMRLIPTTLVCKWTVSDAKSSVENQKIVGQSAWLCKTTRLPNIEVR